MTSAVLSGGSIATDRESFRAQATAALKKFGTDDRELAASLQGEHTSVDEVLRAWQQLLQPAYRDLEAKQHDAKFKKSLIKTMGFHDDEAAASVIDYMVAERKETLLNEVLDSLYPESKGDATTYQREASADFLSRPEVELDDFASRYADFSRALEMADKHKVALCDPHANWLERQRASSAIKQERQKSTQQEEVRLHEIERELHALINDPHSLLGRIVQKDWQFVTVLDLRNKYHKQVEALSAADSKSPSKKLKLFERVTLSFRDRETEKLASHHASKSLKTLRNINEEISDLLFEIFDLNNVERNKLLLDIQRHTKLTQEHDLIQLIQDNRENFLAVHE